MLPKELRKSKWKERKQEKVFENYYEGIQQKEMHLLDTDKAT
jgi:hypothetical protein